MTLANDIVLFANGNTDFYEAAVRYFSFENERTADHNKTLNDAWFAEVERKSGVKMEGVDRDAWIAHPVVKWASLAIVDATINAIIPAVILPQFDIFAEFRTAGVGDIVKFKVMPNSFYTVSKGGRGERTTFRQKKYAADVTVTPEEHLITVFADMYSVLSGKEDIARFLEMVVRSMEREMYSDALSALTTGLSAISDSSLNVSGAFSMKTLINMCETVQAYNAGVRPIIVGSATALMNVVPDSTIGYRMNVDGNGGSVEILKNVMGYTVMKLDNALASSGSLALSSNQIFVVSPAQDKLVKGVMSTALTNSNQFYDNADITQNFTYRKLFAFQYVSAAKAGIYTISD